MPKLVVGALVDQGRLARMGSWMMVSILRGATGGCWREARKGLGASSAYF